MEALNVEIVVLLLTLLGFGSSLIHYSAYAKNKARSSVRIKKDSIDL